MISLLAYLPSTFLVPQWGYALFIVALVFRSRQQIQSEFKSLFFSNQKWRFTVSFYLLMTFLALSLVNNIWNASQISSVKDALPYAFLMVVTIYLSRFLNKRDLMMLCLFFGLEILVGVVEFIQGVNSIFTFHPNYESGLNDSLLYFRRVYGLSHNSSALAEKSFLGLGIILTTSSWKKWFGKLLIPLFLVGLIITFARTAMVATGVMLLVWAWVVFSERYKSAGSWLALVSVVVIASFCLVFASIEFADVIVNQFTRSTGGVELTGRGKIWSDFWTFIKSKPLWGNGSFKLWLKDYHAHSSYLETLASHGLIVSFPFFLFVLRNINFSNVVIVAGVLVYGIAQYAFFWGISLFDLVFFAMLISTKWNVSTTRQE